MVNATDDEGYIVIRTDGVNDLEEVVWAYTQAALKRNEMDVSLTALQLGIDRNTLYRRIRRHCGKK